jgi:hypothetical protein
MLMPFFFGQGTALPESTLSETLSVSQAKSGSPPRHTPPEQTGFGKGATQIEPEI